MGETHYDGPVALSWWQTLWDGRRAGKHDLVLHEFAHQLTRHGDRRSGTPPTEDFALERVGRDRQHRADAFNVNVDASTGKPLTANGVNAVVTLDGQGGDDTYIVNLIRGIANSLINVFDTGVPSSGVDLITVNGQNDLTNLLLLRASASELGEAFIVLLNSDPSKPAVQQPVERVNYNTNLEGITVNGGSKADRSYIDDTRARITLNGGAGNDFFQVGRLY